MEWTAPASAGQGAPPTVMIVDSSGSMATRELGDSVRLDAARAAIVEALKYWPEGGQLAVVAYGHRRTSDCSDIETIVPMGPLSIETVKARLASLRARGKTPLSESLRTAASLLPASGGDIVLVSDGLETCQADPCAVAEALRTANASLAIHVIGFGVTPGERAQLQCIAAAGGGRYFGADDARGLAAALAEVADVVALAPPTDPMAPQREIAAPPPVPAVPPPPLLKPISLRATAGESGEIIDAPVAWLVKVESGEVVYEGESRALSLTLAPGSYRVVARASNAVGDAEIIVRDDAAEQEFDVEVEAGRLDLSLAPNAKAEPLDDRDADGVAWTLEPLDSQPAVEVPPLARPSLLLAPGRYHVIAKLADMTAEATFAIVAGTSVTQVLDLQLGVLVLEAATAADAAPLFDDRAISWTIGDAAKDVVKASRPRLTLKAGTYPVALSISGGNISAEATVVAGEETVRRVIIEGGELTLAARLGPGAALLDDWRDATWTVTAVAALGVPAGAPSSDDALVEAQPRLTLMPGTWRVAVQSGLAHAEREVTVRPAQSTDLVVDLDAARLTMNATVASGEQPTNIVYEAYALGANGVASEVPIFSIGSSGETSAILPSGEWRVIATDDLQRKAERDVDLQAGQDLRLDLDLD